MNILNGGPGGFLLITVFSWDLFIGVLWFFLVLLRAPGRLAAGAHHRLKLTSTQGSGDQTVSHYGDGCATGEHVVHNGFHDKWDSHSYSYNIE